MMDKAYSGMRVWRGFRSMDYLENRPRFLNTLKSQFIPQTAQQMMPLGLQAYFPAIVPKTACSSLRVVPDEIALVVYPSQSVYEQATQNSVAGRAYGALHGTAFNFSSDAVTPKSTSDSPLLWQPGWDYGKSYSLFPTAIDWRKGSTRVLLAQPSAELNRLQFYRALDSVVNQWRDKGSTGVDAGILCTELDWLLYWEHSPANKSVEETQGSLIPNIAPLLETPLINAVARTVLIPPAFSLPDPGIECDEGELLCVTTGLS
ncbi:hypothetical protein SAMN02745866_01221 [Alteromonadaceae bacterium Bs31]|nr:hypothetical protein SAMN02745866_01221 [Alteromonadaceae bacterium Bs31]